MPDITDRIKVLLACDPKLRKNLDFLMKKYAVNTLGDLFLYATDDEREILMPVVKIALMMAKISLVGVIFS